MKTVVEVCPHCESENEIVWDVEKEGLKAYCPRCGRKMMLCSECHMLHNHCDWGNDTCSEDNILPKHFKKILYNSFMRRKGGQTMNNEKTTATDLSGAPEEVKAQILENTQKLIDRSNGKRTRLVYICSRYRDDPDRNVQKAQEYCREAMEIWPDVLPIAPHVYFTQFLNDSVERERTIGLEAGISLLDMCDELWVYGIENPSAGMAAEIKYAREHEIPVIDAAKLYKSGITPNQDSKLGNVIISVPPSQSESKITIEGELICRLAKQLRLNHVNNLFITGEL